jgi:hypothetical protein
MTEDQPSPATASAEADDPLLSILEVARLAGVGTPTAIGYVVEMGLRSLDQGVFIRSGRLDLPVIRRSEFDRFVDQYEGSLPAEVAPFLPENMLDSEELLAAFYFVMSLQDGDLDGVWNTSSRASKEALGDPKTLANWWSQYLAIADASEPGVSSAVYLIGKEQVAIKYMADTPPSGGIMKGRAIVEANPIGLVLDPEGWRVDQPLQARCAEWRHLVGGPPPDEASGTANGPD